MTDRSPPPPRTGPGSLHQWRLWLSGLVGSRYDGLTHFHIVEPGVLMRSGQPRLADLEYIRAEHGLRTIVYARGGTRHPLRGRWFRRQRAWCQRHDVQLEHMPFSDDVAPPPDIFERFLAIVSRPNGRPILVHCEQGFHRTGLLVAAYRLRLCGWTLDQTLAELGLHGFQTDRPKRRPLIDALLNWARCQAQPAQAQKEGAGPAPSRDA